MSVKRRNLVAVISSDEILISNVQDALDLMATIRYQYACDKMVLPKSAIAERFSDLKTGMAGDILQKYTNYQVKIAIAGDFEIFGSKSLRDFIYESNMGSQVFFCPRRKPRSKSCTACRGLHSTDHSFYGETAVLGGFSFFCT